MGAMKAFHIDHLNELSEEEQVEFGVEQSKRNTIYDIGVSFEDVNNVFGASR